MIGLHDIEAARARIASSIRQTPIMALQRAGKPLALEAEVIAKLELHQITGSFKARGAMNRLLSLSPEVAARGIIAASGGNHGLAVAYAAQTAGHRARIYCPDNVAPSKVERMRRFGAEVFTGGADFSIADAAARADAEASGAIYFHPFADPEVVAGQGTVGLELAEQIAEFDTLLVAIGGAGLMAGMATALRALKPDLRIIGVEPEGAPTLKACLDAGKLVTLPEITSRVPTLSARTTDPRIFEIAKSVLDDIVLIPDDATGEAARWLWSEFAIAADLAGSASVAALIHKPDSVAGSGRIALLVCGSGLDGTI